MLFLFFFSKQKCKKTTKKYAFPAFRVFRRLEPLGFLNSKFSWLESVKKQNKQENNNAAIQIDAVTNSITKDLSRMYYVPAKYKDAFNFIFSQDGKVMDPNYLMDKHPYVVPNENFFDRLPEAIKKGLIEHRKGKLNNTNITWSNYKKQVDTT